MLVAFQDSPFAERLALLQDSGQASDETLALVLSIVARIEADYGVRLDEDNAAMFVTHLALAIQRLVNGEPLENFPPVVVNEARTYAAESVYAQHIAQNVAAITGKQLPEGEIGYVTIHLRRITQELQTGQ